MSKSYDLSTSSKWANLAAGSHTVKIRAKGSGYADSPFSNEVSVTKAASTKTLEAGTYKWADGPNFPQNVLTQEFIFISNNTTYTGLTLYPGTNSSVSLLSVVKPQISVDEIFYDNDLSYTVLSGWQVVAYQTITLSTDQTVSAEFYEWAITGGNLVKQESETWVLNETLSSDILDAEIDFTCDSTSYSQIKTAKTLGIFHLYYVNSDIETAVYIGSEWNDDVYRTITFQTPPTGDLLTWLQANGTKQGVTEHTLTFSSGYSEVTVDNAVVTSPYTLTKDCSIILKCARLIVVNGEDALDGDTLSLSDVDIDCTARGTPSIGYNITVTINYTA